jgi:hypothetical protein
VWTTIYQLGQREVLAASATLWPLNPRHVRHVHRGELRMQLTHRPRAHSDEHSRSQPQEQVTSQRLVILASASATMGSRQCFMVSE